MGAITFVEAEVELGPKPARIIAPRPSPVVPAVVVVDGLLRKETVEPPTTSPAEPPSEIAVPLIVTALPPSPRVVPPTSIAVGLMVKVSPPMTVVLDGKAPEGMAYVDDAITMPELPREIAVPETVRADPPSVSVVPAMPTAMGFAVKT